MRKAQFIITLIITTLLLSFSFANANDNSFFNYRGSYSLIKNNSFADELASLSKSIFPTSSIPSSLEAQIMAEGTSVHIK